jgi:hypothetical protein
MNGVWENLYVLLKTYLRHKLHWTKTNKTWILLMTFSAHHQHCRRQFTWRLHSIVAILAPLVMAWFMQRDGNAGTHQSENILHGGFNSTDTRSLCSFCAYNGDKLLRAVVISSRGGIRHSCARGKVWMLRPQWNNFYLSLKTWVYLQCRDIT